MNAVGGRRINPDGYPCLACNERTTNEGQLCTACVDKGHRVINDTLEINLTPFVRASGNQRWTMFRPIDDSEADQ